MDTMSLTAKYEDEMIAIRRHIHRHPELSNKEYKTTEFIREKLTEYGVEIAEIGMKTGVVAVIRAENREKPLRSARISMHFR